MAETAAQKKARLAKEANVVPAFNPNTAVPTTQFDDPKFTGWATYDSVNGDKVALWRKNGKIDPQNKGDVYYILKQGKWYNAKDNKVYKTEAIDKAATEMASTQMTSGGQTPAQAAAAAAAKTTNAEIAANLGIGEALLLDKIYGKELEEVFKLYKTNPVAARDLLFKTKWGKLDSDARTNYLLKLENSDLYKERLKSWKLSLIPNLKARGITYTDAQLDDYYLRGIDGLTIIDELSSGQKFQPGKTGGTQATDYNTLLGTATRNGISADMLPKVLGFDTIDQVTKELQSGASIEDFNQKIRNYAKTAMPEWAKKLIDEGNDLTEIVNPYRATIADELELPYTSIDVTDRNIQNALAGNISLAELRKQLRKDDRWQYTDKARSQVANATKQVLQDFGFMG